MEEYVWRSGPVRPDLPFVLALPIFPARLQASIVGRIELNFCVRDGNRWTLDLINTNYCNRSRGNKLNCNAFASLCQEGKW